MSKNKNRKKIKKNKLSAPESQPGPSHSASKNEAGVTDPLQKVVATPTSAGSGPSPSSQSGTEQDSMSIQETSTPEIPETKMAPKTAAPSQDLFSKLRDAQGGFESEEEDAHPSTSDTQQLMEHKAGADGMGLVMESSSDKAAFSGSKDDIGSGWSFAEVTPEEPKDDRSQIAHVKDDSTVEKEVDAHEMDIAAPTEDNAATVACSGATGDDAQAPEETPDGAIPDDFKPRNVLEARLHAAEAQLQATENSMMECEEKLQKSEAERHNLQAMLEAARNNLATGQDEDNHLRDQDADKGKTNRLARERKLEACIEELEKQLHEANRQVSLVASLDEKNTKLKKEMRDVEKRKYRLESDLKNERDRLVRLETQILSYIPPELETASLGDRVEGLHMLLNKTKGDLAAAVQEVRELQRENVLLRLEGAQTKQEIVDMFANKLVPQTNLYEAVQAYALHRDGKGIKPSEEQMEEISSFRDFMEARDQLLNKVFTAADPWPSVGEFEKDWTSTVLEHDWAPLEMYRMSALRAYFVVRDSEDEKPCGEAVELMNSQVHVVRERAGDGTIWELVGEVNEMYDELKQRMERRRMRT